MEHRLRRRGRSPAPQPVTIVCDDAPPVASNVVMRTLQPLQPLLLLLATLVLAGTATAAPLAPGAALPPLRGELLTGRDAELPALTHGKVALVAFGFTRNSSKDVEAWVGRFKSAYGSDTSFTWIEVPLINSGMAKLMKPLIQGGMRGGTPEPDRAHVMTVWGAPHAWKDWLEFGEPASAYLVLLDREGRVRWRGAGPLDDSRWRELAAAGNTLR